MLGVTKLPPNLYRTGLTLLLYDDDDLAQYVAKYAPEFRPDFLTLDSAVERSDLWR